MTTPKAYAQIFENAGTQPRDAAAIPIFHFRAARLRLLAFAALSFLGVSLLASCGGSGSTAITLEVTPNTSQTVDQGQVIQFNAILGNDTGNKGVTWKAPTGSGCAGTGCGTLTNVTKTSVTYTAPTNSSIALSISLIAVANGNSSATVTTMINVVLPPTFTTQTLVNGSNGAQYGQQIVATGGVPPLVFTIVCPSNQPSCLPPGLSLNQTGFLLGTPTSSGTFSFFVKVTDNGAVQQPNGAPKPISVISPLFTVTINPATALSVTSTSLPPGTVNVPYSATLTATGGVTPYTWSVPANSLPPGLGLNTSTGRISGTPTTVGSTSITATVQDSSIPVQTASSVPLTISIQTAQPLQATTPALPPGMTATSYSASLTATGGTQPYTWSVISGQLPAGLSLDSSGAISGIPILVGTSNFTVQVQDSSAGAGGPQKATQQLHITITTGSTSSNSLITGNYSFLFNGFDANGTVIIAGNFAANGAGSVLSGQADINRVTGVVDGASLTGTYTVATDGRGTMQLIYTTGIGTVFTGNYLLALDSNGNIHVIENDTTGTNGVGITHGSGIMKPSIGAFVGGNFSGNYAFEFAGADFLAAPAVLAGVVTADGGQTLKPGTADFNDNGVYSSQMSLTGSFGVGSSNSKGVATMTFQPPTAAQLNLTFTFYFVSAKDIFFMEIDSGSTTNPLPRLSGEMLLQDPATQFNQTTLQGSGVVTGTGLDGANSSVFVGLLTSPAGDGTATLNFDQNDGGAVTLLNSLPGTYQVLQNGRVGFTNLGNRLAAAYLIGPDQGFIIGSDSAATYGLLEQQTGTPDSLSSIQGSYALFAPTEAETQAVNMIGELSSAGAGNIVGTLDEFIPPNTSSTGLAFSANYTIAADGRGTMTPILIAGFPSNLVFYVVSPSSVRMIPTDSNPGNGHPQIIFLSH